MSPAPPLPAPTATMSPIPAGAESLWPQHQSIVPPLFHPVPAVNVSPPPLAPLQTTYQVSEESLVVLHYS